MTFKTLVDINLKKLIFIGENVEKDCRSFKSKDAIKLGSIQEKKGSRSLYITPKNKNGTAFNYPIFDILNR
jgi:hypothetical protein